MQSPAYPRRIAFSFGPDDTPETVATEINALSTDEIPGPTATVEDGKVIVDPGYNWPFELPPGQILICIGTFEGWCPEGFPMTPEMFAHCFETTD